VSGDVQCPQFVGEKLENWADGWVYVGCVELIRW